MPRIEALSRPTPTPHKARPITSIWIGAGPCDWGWSREKTVVGFKLFPVPIAPAPCSSSILSVAFVLMIVALVHLQIETAHDAHSVTTRYAYDLSSFRA